MPSETPIGSVWKSKDSREPGRRVRVHSFAPGSFAICEPVVGPGLRGGRRTKIRIKNLKKRFRRVA